MNKTKKYISVIVEILLVFSIILAVLAIFVKGFVLNKDVYVNIFNKNGTYDQVKESIYEKMDKVLGTNNIDNDIKESIISDEDIKKEADSAITGFIQYLKTGENNITPIDTEMYKQRVKELLNTVLVNFVNPSKDDVSFNTSMQPENMAVTKNELQFENMVSTKKEVQLNNMVLSKNQSQTGQDQIYMEKLMTASEAQSKIQSLLKEKGLTEAQARQKMAEKGITEEQALKILASYGISIDDESKSGGSGSSNNSQDQTSGTVDGNQNQNSGTVNNNGNNIAEGSNNNQDSGISDSTQNKNSTSNGALGQGTENVNGENNEQASSRVSFISKLQEEIINAITNNDGTSIQEKLNNIENKLLDDLGTSIDNEIEKMNLNKLMESSKIQKLAKITSMFSKMFWLFMILPIILILILIKLNDAKLYSSLKSIGSGFILAGLSIFAIFFGSYISKFYENININTVYFKDVISVIVKQFLIVLSTSGIITFGIGLILLIPIIKNVSINKLKH